MQYSGLERRSEIRIISKIGSGVSMRLVCPCERLLAEDFDGGGGFACASCGYRCTVEEVSELAQRALREITAFLYTLTEQGGINPLAVRDLFVCP